MPPPWHHLCYHRNHQPENFRKTRQSAWFVGGWTSSVQLASTPLSTGCRTTCSFASRPSRYRQRTMETEPKQKYWQLFDTIKVSAYYISWMLMLQNFWLSTPFSPSEPNASSRVSSSEPSSSSGMWHRWNPSHEAHSSSGEEHRNRTIIISFVINLWKLTWSLLLRWPLASTSRENTFASSQERWDYILLWH